MNRIRIFDNERNNVIFSYDCEDNTVAGTLERAVTYGVSLRYANLSGADLRDVNLRGVDLRYASLSGADLRDANLCDANLRGANLCGANLCGANLCDANLRDANLCGANLHMVLGLYCACPTEGEFIGWKKASGFIVKLRIPADALRSSAASTKCRCNKAFVLDIQNCDGGETDVYSVASDMDSTFKYVRNSWVAVDDFDTNRWNECAPGIHFFVDRQEAVDY